MKIKITSDSTCDLSEEIRRQFDISMISLHINKDGKQYKDGINIVPQEIFNHVNSGGDICTTSAVNPFEYKIFFEELLEQYDVIIHITIGSGFSSCYNNACIAADDYDNVYIVDSKNLSTGQGHVVMEAAKKAIEGITPQEIIEHLNHIIPKVRASFLLDRLDYMAKGGRCSSILALSANLLQLKPCIEVIDGKMQVGRKFRGSLHKCLLQYVNDKLDNPEGIASERVFITHTTINPIMVDEIKDIVKHKVNPTNIYETNAGCTISSHCGQNTLGVLFIEK